MTAPPQSPPAKADLIFDKYEIIKRLAVGGMGEIFLARQTGLAGFQRLVILKSMLPDLAQSKTAVESFLDEARIAATLNHANIVGVHEVGRWQGTYYLAMEYLNGDNIAALLTVMTEKQMRIPVPITVRIVHDAALGLDHAHQARDPEGAPLNIVHRDVSPHNIMVTMDGVTKVVDFGIAIAANRDARTRTGMVKGKFRYMSPEQARGAEVDARTDQFALGIVLWEMLAGRRLFVSKDDVAERAVLDQRIPRLLEIVPTIPPEIDEACARALSRDKKARFASCAEFAQALSPFLHKKAAAAEAAVVGAFVREHLGMRIKERTQHTGKTDPGRKEENFVVTLSGSDSVRALSDPGLGPQTSAKTISSQTPALAPVRVYSPEIRGSQAPILVITLAGLIGLGAFVLLRSTPTPVPVEVTTDLPEEPNPGDDLEPVQEPPSVPAPEPRRVAPVTTKVAFVSEPDQAEVLRGSDRLGQTPFETDALAPDVDHVIWLRKSGFEPAQVVVRPKSGERSEVKVALIREAAEREAVRKPEKPAAFGFLTLNTNPWTNVSVQGRDLGATPLYMVKVPAGELSVKLENKELGVSKTQSITIKANETTKLDLNVGP